MRLPIRAVRIVALIGLLLAVGGAYPAGATNLTGTFRHPDGSLVNGKLVFLLSQPARLNDGTAQVVPMVKIFSVTNGALEPGAFLYGNDVLLPTGTYYLVRLVDNNNNLLFEQKWSIQGTNLDLGTMTPTTAGVVIPDPLLKNATVQQSVQGPVTFSSPITAFSLTLNGNLFPGTGEVYDLGSPAAAWRELSVGALHVKNGMPWFDVTSFGAVADGNGTCSSGTDNTAAIQAAINAAAAAGGGVVYVPPGARTGISGSTGHYRASSTLTTAPVTGGAGGVTILLGGTLCLGGATGFDIVNTNYSLVGTGGNNSAVNSFQRYPAVRIAHGSSTTKVIHIGGGSIGSILLENVAMKLANASGLIGIHIDDGPTWITLRGVNLEVTAAGSTAIPLQIDSSFGVFIEDSGFSAQDSPNGAIYIKGVTSGPGQIHFRNLFLARRGIHYKPVAGTDAGAMEIRGALYEGGVEPFLTVSNVNGATQPVRGVALEDVAIADWAAGGNSTLISQPSGTLARGFIVENPRDVEQIVSGNAIQGLVLRRLDANSAVIGQAQYVTVEEPNTPTSWRRFNNDELLFAEGKVGIVSPGGTYFSSTELKAPLHLRQQGGIAVTPAANSPLYLESDQPSLNLQFGGPTNQAQTLTFGDTAASTQAVFGYAHDGDQFLWNVGPGARKMELTGSLVRFFDDVYWRSGTSFDGILAHNISSTRTWTLPDASGTVPLLEGTQTWTATQTFSASPPLATSSTAEVGNLNAERWHGKQAVDFSGTLDFGPIAPQTCAQLTVGAGGSAAGSPVAAGWPATLEAGLMGQMFVSSADVVTVRLCNVTASAIDPASQTYAGRVIR